MRAYLKRMFHYVAWADARVLYGLDAFPPAQLEAVPLFAHVLAAEHVWLSRLQQRSSSYPIWPTLTLRQCGALASENKSGYEAFLAQLEDKRLNDLVLYHNSQRHEFSTSIVDILTQVITHGPYHRGQIAKIISRTGGTAANTDYITFIRDIGERTNQ